MELFAMGWSMLVSVFMFVLGLAVLLSIFGLPGNWILIILVAVCHFLLPESPLGLVYWAAVLGIAVLGEMLEFFLQMRQSKQYGSSTAGTLGGVVLAFIGAVLMAPFLFGVGAFIGALAGAWLGCFLVELMRGQNRRKAARAALGAMFGRFIGTVCKLACGVVIWAVTLQSLWPDPNALPFHFEWMPMPAPALQPGAERVLGLVQSFLV